MNRRLRTPIWGLVILIAATVPPLRQWLERSMLHHMLLQFPMLLVAGAMLATCLPDPLLRRLQRWNAHGIAGLTGSALVLALCMIPRVLDLALAAWPADALKVLALLLSGAALRLSWRSAGFVIQGFFLGNLLPMTAIVGWLYQDALVRVCNAYRMDEQQAVGLALVWFALALGSAWLCQAGWRLSRPAP